MYDKKYIESQKENADRLDFCARLRKKLNDCKYLLIGIVYFLKHKKEIFAVSICRESLQLLFAM